MGQPTQACFRSDCRAAFPYPKGTISSLPSMCRRAVYCIEGRRCTLSDHIVLWSHFPVDLCIAAAYNTRRADA
jgi:hypothetical protein